MAQVKVRLSEVKKRFGYVIRYATLHSDQILNLQAPTPRMIAHQGIEFWSKLEEHILQHGVENPILVYAGSVPDYLKKRLPKPFRNNIKSVIGCIHGGSRLWVAQKHHLKVPCVIVDWTGKFRTSKLISSNRQLLSLYKTPPTDYVFNPTGLVYYSLPHYHLVGK